MPNATGWFATFLSWFNYDTASYAILYFILIMGFNSSMWRFSTIPLKSPTT